MTMPPASSATRPAPHVAAAATRRAETLMFLALSVLVWPVISVGVVGAYGFAIWMSQLLFHTPMAH